MLASDGINEQNIDKVRNYLRIFHPDVATPEMAIRILEVMSISAHRAVAHNEPVDLEKMIEEALNDLDGN